MSLPAAELRRLYDRLAQLNPVSDEYKRRKEQITSEEYAVIHDASANPEDVARIADWRCEHCEELMIPKRYQPRPKGVPGLGFWLRPSQHGCKQETENKRKFDIEEKRIQADKNAAQWRKRLDNAGLVGRLADCTFNNFTARQDWQEAADIKTQVNEYANLLLSGELLDKNWLVLTGPVGTGKSHLAAAVIREALYQGKRAYFRSWTAYLQRIQASWDKRGDANGERESDIVNELNQGWLVVIDDLDKRRSTEWVKGTLYTFLNNRYTKQLPTIITLNTPLTAIDKAAPGRLALHDIMGGAVLDRTIESMWKYIEFSGPSFRSGQKWRY